MNWEEKLKEKFEVGNKVRRSHSWRKFSETFTGGKEIETIAKIEPNEKISETKLWLTNGMWVNPLMVEKLSGISFR